MQKYGLVGTGRQAKRLAEAVKTSGSNIVAITSRKEQRGKEFSEENQLCADIYESYHEMLATDISAVFIASPDFLHASQGVDALEAGKHVFLEKPVSNNEQSAEALLIASKLKPQLVLAIGFHMRWSTGFRYLKELIGEGYFGNIKRLNIHWGLEMKPDQNWRQSADSWWCLSALAPHCIDLVQWFCDDCGPIVFADGVCSNEGYKLASEDSSLFQIGFESGCRATVFCSVAKKHPLEIEVIGEKRSLKSSNLLGQNQHLKLDGEITRFSYENPWHLCVKNFGEVIAGLQGNVVKIDSAIENQKILNDCKRVEKIQFSDSQ